MTQTLTLATRNALQTCAAFSAHASRMVLIMAASPHLGESLLECLQLTPGIQCMLLPAGEISPSVASAMDSGAEFSLVWVQPLNSKQDPVDSLLRHPKLRQLIVLQASWLGRKMLSEWNTQPRRSLAAGSRIWQIPQAERGWSYQETSVGDLSSLLWGFLSGRLQALNLPDLADRCNARMRRHLFPAVVRLGPAYLSITRAVREHRDVADSGNDSDRQ